MGTYLGSRNDQDLTETGLDGKWTAAAASIRVTTERRLFCVQAIRNGQRVESGNRRFSQWLDPLRGRRFVVWRPWWLKPLAAGVVSAGEVEELDQTGQQGQRLARGQFRAILLPVQRLEADHLVGSRGRQKHECRMADSRR